MSCALEENWTQYYGNIIFFHSLSFNRTTYDVILFCKKKEIHQIRYPRSWAKCLCFLDVIDPIFRVMSKIWQFCTLDWIKTSASEKGGLLRLCTPKSGFIDIVSYLQETRHFQTLISGLKVSMQENWILVLNCTYTWTEIWNRSQSSFPRIPFSLQKYRSHRRI